MLRIAWGYQNSPPSGTALLGALGGISNGGRTGHAYKIIAKSEI